MKKLLIMGIVASILTITSVTTFAATNAKTVKTQNKTVTTTVGQITKSTDARIKDINEQLTSGKISPEQAKNLVTKVKNETQDQIKALNTKTPKATNKTASEAELIKYLDGMNAKIGDAISTLNEELKAGKITQDEYTKESAKVQYDMKEEARQYMIKNFPSK